MPRSLACASCGSAMWAGPGSLPQGQARCQPCRRAERKHGHVAYTKGCRCDMCREAQRVYMREYAARRRAEGRPVQRPGDLRECDQCGSAFVARRDRPGRYCGVECAKIAQGWDEVPSPRFRPSLALRTSIYERDGWVCQLCGDPVDREAAPRTRGYASLDHVIPRSHGGPDEASNLRLAHMGCNADRGATVEAA